VIIEGTDKRLSFGRRGRAVPVVELMEVEPMKLSCGDAGAARACAAADKAGALVGLVPERERHEARRLAKLGRLVSLNLVKIPAIRADVAGFWGTSSGRLVAAVELADRPATRRWCVVRIEPMLTAGVVTTHTARVILRFEVMRRERSQGVGVRVSGSGKNLHGVSPSPALA